MGAQLLSPRARGAKLSVPCRLQLLPNLQKGAENVDNKRKLLYILLYRKEGWTGFPYAEVRLVILKLTEVTNEPLRKL